MTWSAALSGAALRVMRTAAGRRALQVVLLVGGVLALGLLCGEQAHAADGAPTAASTSIEAVSSDAADGVRSLTRGEVGRLVNHPTQPATHGSAAHARLTASSGHAKPTAPSDDARPTAPAERPVPADRPDPVGSPTSAEPSAPTDPTAPEADRLVRPVGDPVGPVTEGLADGLADGLAGAHAKAPPLSRLPSLPAPTDSPGLPGLPDLPGVPDLPGDGVPPALPGVPSLPSPPDVPAIPTLPGHTLPTPIPPAPQPGSAATPSADGRASDGPEGAAAVGYGPTFAGADADAATHGHPAAPTENTPAHHAPTGDPGGALGNRSAADNGTPRHGDAHAVTLNHRAPLRLVAGAAARTDAAKTRDRYRDIPVFPA